MSANRLPSTTRMRAWRLAGQLVCQCVAPVRRHVAPFNGDECATCSKLVTGRVGEELIMRTLDALAIEP